MSGIADRHRHPLRAAFAATLASAVAVAAAVVVLAAHQNVHRPVMPASPAGVTHIVFSGSISGTMQVTSVQCDPAQRAGQRAETWTGPGTPAPVSPAPYVFTKDVPATMRIEGTADGRSWQLQVNHGVAGQKLDLSSEGVAIAPAGNSIAPAYGTTDTTGISAFIESRGATIDVTMRPFTVNGAPTGSGTVHASGTIVCP